ncbi:histidine kinase [Scytonema hofmannii FACHB-248]|uniref:Histidine kinase n=1 Tax=Scytonema hofmannii FACHB-248 TaxID=1842502 RepID=A0ABR8GNJ3_9CYAN|nr:MULTISPECIES: histidine kinase [Nostocales]MBD2604769.1 histidine kinase [Scytonema hofmannii FACHB-248]
MQSIINRFSTIKSTKNQVILAIGCMALFVVPALLVKATSSRNRVLVLTWTDAQNIVPASLIKRALRENSTGDVEAKSIKVLQVPSQGAGKLYIFDFQLPQLCGTNGCVYPVYQESGKLVLSVIVNPNLPKGEVLIRADNTVQNGFSCLVITQTTSIEGMVSRSQYCYQGAGFVKLNEALTKVGENFGG